MMKIWTVGLPGTMNYLRHRIKRHRKLTTWLEIHVKRFAGI